MNKLYIRLALPTSSPVLPIVLQNYHALTGTWLSWGGSLSDQMPIENELLKQNNWTKSQFTKKSLTNNITLQIPIDRIYNSISNH